MSSVGASETPTTPSATYTGSCHCGHFTYTVTQSPPLDNPSCEVTDCNCSICSRNGYLFIYPSEKNVTFTSGAKSEFKKYYFGTRKFAQYFCATCGSSCMAESEDPNMYPGIIAVNVRMFQDLDLKSLNLKSVDGKRI